MELNNVFTIYCEIKTEQEISGNFSYLDLFLIILHHSQILRVALA